MKVFSAMVNRIIVHSDVPDRLQLYILILKTINDSLMKERFITLGKYSEGVRESYCKVKRNEYMTLSKNGELPPQIERRIKKQITTFDDIAIEHYLQYYEFNVVFMYI